MLFSVNRVRCLAFTLFMGWFMSCSTGAEFENIITSAVERKDFVDMVTVHGTLEAIKTHNYPCPGLRYDATIKYLIPEGTQVTIGDTLFILEASEINKKYHQALDEVEKAKAAYNKSKAELKLQYLLLEAEVSNIEASTEITRLDSVQMKFTSPSSQEIIRLELKKAEVEKSNKLKMLEFLKQINDAELQKKKLEIDQQQNQADKAKSDLDKHTVTSAVDGIVLYEILRSTDVKVREGDIVWWVLPIIKIPDLKSMQVKMEVLEADYKRLANEQTMMIRVDAFSDIELSGKIKFKAPVGKPIKRDSQVKMFEVTASLDSSSFSIQPGLTVTCNVLINSVPDTLVVPAVSVFDEDSLKVVYVAHNRQFLRKAVSLADINNREAIVKEGLEGEEILALMKPPDSLIKNQSDQ